MKVFLPHTAVALRNRSPEATHSDKQPPRSAGFGETAKTGDEFLMVARSLASDRFLLLIPVWAYVACLVLAAALTRVSNNVFLYHLACFCCAALLDSGKEPPQHPAGFLKQEHRRKNPLVLKQSDGRNCLVYTRFSIVRSTAHDSVNLNIFDVVWSKKASTPCPFLELDDLW